MKLKEGSVKSIHSSLKELTLELEKFAVCKRYEGEKECRRWESTKVDRYMEINVLHIHTVSVRESRQEGPRAQREVKSVYIASPLHLELHRNADRSKERGRQI